jgi:hypothetical protein
MIGTWWYNAIDCVIFPADEPLSFARTDGFTRADGITRAGE